MITISSRAAKKITSLLKKHSEADGLRINVISGGCNGMQYEYTMDTKRERDAVFEEGSARVLIDPKSLLFVKGSEFDYSSDLLREGFEMKNPNVTATCGCGVSFNI